ncbi:hypothetical protein D0817_15875 [Flavobacterium cupreum]|uniref:Uncharacterized protein n=1 Tax=Flavobacterium cupreum TaxID=2133766 RepID=A0A434A4J5_9FLAO|nr:hypothetical protein [Flavobacterium cupreum]RUT69323.1 hypothetical protein D0817_15875 [Flavobacterium cupreum]
MNEKNENQKNNKVEEPAVEYEVQKPRINRIDPDTFDFDAEFEKGLTPEEFKAEMAKRIKAYPWKK